ncbi:hypothetical protein HanXRQr2_Chr17g0818961 [Helianthus annuus]|uniref:Uncharacterized protein n=1 Tax=Helianthus annuus TaxID=4232 RepID=A0A251TT20_HELAN|nr:hypothetical protein HanXRQr2_Chr17g0818961 [Helianthus annuus]
MLQHLEIFEKSYVFCLIVPELSQISLNVVILALQIELSLIVGNINRKPLIDV